MKERLINFLAYLEMGQTRFEEKVGLSRGFVNKIGESVKDKTLKRITDVYPELNINWLKTGDGYMLKNGFAKTEKVESKKLIPFYDDVSTIGGKNEKVANMQGISTPSEYIDTGDWFKDATAAIRHYGESMIEYPEGCILAIKEVLDRRLVVPGRDYMIETTEYRVTKQLQLCKDETCIMAYSTNNETYPDGKQIHGPFPIPWDSITRISLVLGYVVKKNGGTIVFSNQQK
jgi:hypothetical protein